ncbi:MAG: hypothetical protein V7K89_00050 [Nostoc sp.]|uniref:hypothetical protein n=1 Tax=Nostoc sp. TaxID=1180 RepID=UPI002FFBA985
MSKDDKDFDADKLQKLWDLINPEVAPQHKQKAYKAGWNYERAEEARQQININKPWLFSTGVRTRVGKKIVSRNALKHGLYSSVLKNSNLESVEISVHYSNTFSKCIKNQRQATDPMAAC